MTKKEQKRIIRELLRGVKKRMLENLPRVPNEWNGHELRQWLADIVAEDVNYIQLPRGVRRDYENERITRNL